MFNYVVLLNLDINQLENLCQTNLQFNQFCHDPLFWVEKMEHDQLYIPTINLLEVKTLLKVIKFYKK